jgi:two-component sensor histidine kinase
MRTHVDLHALRLSSIGSTRSARRRVKRGRRPQLMVRAVLKFVNSRLSFGLRLTLLVAVLLGPLLLMSGLFARQSWRDIACVDREREGAAYLSAIWPLYERAAAGAPDDAGQIRRFDLASGRFDREFDTRALSRAFAHARSPGEQVERGRELISIVADRADLILAPSPDSFYLVDAATAYLPMLAKAATDLAHADADVTALLERAARVSAALDRAQMSAAAAETSLAKAMPADASREARRALAAHARALKTDVDALIDAARAAAQGAAPETSRLQAAEQSLERRIDETWRASEAELAHRLEARRSRLATELWSSLAIVGLSLAASAAIAWAMVHGLAVRGRDLFATMRRLSAGDFAAEVPYRDEPGEIGCIAEGLQTLKQATKERARLTAELEAANRSLGDQRTWLKLALEAGRMGVWRRHLPGEQLDISPELSLLLGFPADTPPRVLDEIAPMLADPEHGRVFEEEGRRVGTGEVPLAELVLPLRRFDTNEIRWFMLRRELVVDPARGLRQVVGVAIDITDRKHMTDELNHRVKNNLATVLSLALQTAKTTEDLKLFLKLFTGRVQALSKVNELLTRHAWTDVRLKDLLAMALKPYLDEGLAVTGGSPDDLAVGARAAVSLSLVLHELASAATRHGALAGDGGRVEVSWSRPDPEHGALVWTERSFAPVQSSEADETSARLVERLTSGDLGGHADFDARPDGLDARISFALAGATA